MLKWNKLAVRLCVATALFAFFAQSNAEAAWWKSGWFRHPAKDQCDSCRAGCPNYVAKYARAPYGDKYCGYYVGGGAAFSRHSESRYVDEGTFGMDYRLWKQRIALDWYHGRKYQDGRGQFEMNIENEPFITARQDRARRKGIPLRERGHHGGGHGEGGGHGGGGH